jgi:hypothetical protein
VASGGSASANNLLKLGATNAATLDFWNEDDNYTGLSANVDHLVRVALGG